MIWITTDTHFCHNNLKTLGRGRPHDYEYLLGDSLFAIPEGDTLIHLGDICVGRDLDVHENIIRCLNLKKILVKGNHDQKSDAWYYDHGWDFVCEDATIKFEGKGYYLRHIPLGVEHRPSVGTYKHLHGHFHGDETRLANKPKRMIQGGTYDPTWHYDVAPDNHEFEVLSMKEVAKLCKT